MSISTTNPILSLANSALVDLPGPSSLSYFWNFGSLLGLTLVFQIITGMFLAMHYCPDTQLAFASMNHILSDVNYGFLLKYMHANGASMFFLCVYIHMASGLYYGSYLKSHLWFSGMSLFLVMMITAFMGYVLPWGQMSFWGATVMTNFLSAMPYVGMSMVQWVWGGFSVGNSTLNSFFSLHYLFPFLLAGLSLIHLTLLHQAGSNSPLGMGLDMDKMPFHMYFVAKDLLGLLIIMMMLTILAFYTPNILGDPENYMKANPLVTPVHIMPEWYFLFAYAMLSAMPNKLGGVMALLLSILILFTLPFIHTNKMKNLTFSPLGKMFYWMFMANFILLTWMGSKPVEEPFMFMGQMSSIIYFSYFLIIIPFMGWFENKVMNFDEQ